MHLEEVAVLMGGFLRGFEDSRVHLGTAARFAGEFGRLMRIPALHPSAGDKAVSYAEAAGSYRVPEHAVFDARAADPVSVLIRGLTGSPALESAHPLGVLHPESLRADLGRLLRIPLLRFYLQVAKREAFCTLLKGIAQHGGFPVSGTLRGLPDACPACGHRLAFDAGGAPQCPACSQTLETFLTLPMVPGVRALVSYEMLRQVLELNLVETYQEESEIRPLRPESQAPHDHNR